MSKYREIYKHMNNMDIREKVDYLIKEHKYEEIAPLILSEKKTVEMDTDLSTVYYLCAIYDREKEAEVPTIFSKIESMEELLERFTYLRFYLHRIEFDVIDGKLEEFYQFIHQNHISAYELETAVRYCSVNKEKVLQVIWGGIQTALDQDSFQRINLLKNSQKIVYALFYVQMTSCMHRSVFII